MPKIVLFCQAPADVQYVLALYHKNKAKFEIYIICVNVESMFRFLVGLNLKINKLIYIPYSYNFNSFNPFNFFKEKRRLNKLFNTHFNINEPSRIYFFSHFFDWVTFFFVSRLSQIHETYFVDHYDTSSLSNFNVNNYSLKKILQLIILYYMSNIKFQFVALSGKPRIEFPYWKYKIRKIEPPQFDFDLFSTYSYSFQVNNYPALLIFETNYSNYDTLIRNYLLTMRNILVTLNLKGFKIYIKGHPKNSYSKGLATEICETIPNYIPAEFLKLDSFNAVLGVESVSLANICNRFSLPVISLICLFDWHVESVKEEYINYLTKTSKNRILFPKLMSEFESILA